jgi:hypothetical protein
MPEGMLEDMMAMHLVDGGGGGVLPRQAGAMPGQMPGVEFLGEDVPGQFGARDVQNEVVHEPVVGIENGDEYEDEDEDEDEDEEYISVSFVVCSEFVANAFFSQCPVF